ncbi:unnamed protein product [Protopolystoma xenopodis]|uniref:Uncharacterized protein n=1 Tax=Protopolystoma xenopodis TaxID=117903 RepID=A0A3S5ADA9_9PLAT|nr:unnamed protein product [Protopolystoma xenopodis]
MAFLLLVSIPLRRAISRGAGDERGAKMAIAATTRLPSNLSLEITHSSMPLQTREMHSETVSLVGPC